MLVTTRVRLKLFDNNIDSVLVWLKPTPPPPDIYVVDTTQKVDSSFFYGEKDAQLDLEEGNIQLLTDKGPTEEQNTYAEKHDFKFEIWAGNNYYREAYNEVVIDFLNKKFEKNIEEELREICWRILSTIELNALFHHYFLKLFFNI